MAKFTLLTLFSGEASPLIRRLWRDWMRPHWASLLLVLATVSVLAGASSLYPVVIKTAFDAFDQQNKRLVQLIPFIVIAVTATKGFAMLAQSILTNRVVTRIEADMQAALYAALIDSDLAQLARETPAALAQRFTTDFAYIREALTRLSTVALRDVATGLALLGVMFWIDWQVTLLALVVLPVVAPPIGKIGKKLRRTALNTQEQTGHMAGMVAESLGAARIAKAYGLEGTLKDRARASFDTIRKLKMKSANQRARLDPILEIAGGVAVAGVLVFIGWRIVKNQTTIGDFTGFVTALLLASQSMRTLGNLNAILQEASAALARLFAILDERPTITDAPQATALAVTRGEVAFRGVSFAYAGSQASLRDIDLVLPGGKTTALVGRSGSGKSTLMSLVPRLFDPTDGRVEIDGRDIRGVTLASLRSQIALVTQEALIFDDTVAANIAFGRPSASRDEIEAAARSAAAHDFIMRLPEGYETRLGDRGSRLSGGERQRVSLARAILRQAPILLLDEATSALDSESERLVQDALAALTHGRTSLVIAHRLSTVRSADLIVVLDRGRIVEQGDHDTLLRQGGVYARMHRLQSGDIDELADDAV
ncbi:ABC transporter ATP-binding protein [uncultured Alsobacter sp.]|uniref:ABC transporter ATP-binding protein n=1 Tax=uncultured Alsobacter sp. TaxID=1748258 RepID=UPI0025DE74D0|nr:ABC transporter ATP-binding protein [uncultured Alsobacter sp.]